MDLWGHHLGPVFAIYFFCMCERCNQYGSEVGIVRCHVYFTLLCAEMWKSFAHIAKKFCSLIAEHGVTFSHPEGPLHGRVEAGVLYCNEVFHCNDFSVDFMY